LFFGRSSKLLTDNIPWTRINVRGRGRGSLKSVLQCRVFFYWLACKEIFGSSCFYGPVRI
jgi:hypothetical protein